MALGLNSKTGDGTNMIGNQGNLATSRWSGAAFIVEALLLLFFFACSLAVLVSMFTVAYKEGERAAQGAKAVELASNVAEKFLANPQVIDDIAAKDDVVARITVEKSARERGTFYDASIVVYSVSAKDSADLPSLGGGMGMAEAMALDRNFEQTLEQLPRIYTLDASRYVSEVM